MIQPQRLSQEEIEQVAAQLSRLEPGYLPHPIFLAVTRLAVSPIIEVVPLRMGSNGRPEVLLIRRSVDDPIWPGQLHTPGTVVRATDTEGTEYSDAFKRVLEGELKGIELAGEPVYVQNLLHHSGRGMESSQIFFAEVIKPPEGARFYLVDQLPPQIVKTQVDFIHVAAGRFAAYKLGN